MNSQERGWQIQKKCNQDYLFLSSIYFHKMFWRLGFSVQGRFRERFRYLHGPLLGYFHSLYLKGWILKGYQLFLESEWWNNILNVLNLIITTQRASICGETKLCLQMFFLWSVWNVGPLKLICARPCLCTIMNGTVLVSLT